MRDLGEILYTFDNMSYMEYYMGKYLTCNDLVRLNRVDLLPLLKRFGKHINCNHQYDAIEKGHTDFLKTTTLIGTLDIRLFTPP